MVNSYPPIESMTGQDTLSLEASDSNALILPTKGSKKRKQNDQVANFPFPTSPGSTALVEAERCLKALEALDSNGRLTSPGKAMAHYPMSPRHSRMLLTVIQIMRRVKNYARANLVPGYAVAAAAALSLTNPFVMQYEESYIQIDESKGDHGSGPVDSKKVLNREEKSRKKKLREMAKISRAKFSNPSSDTLWLMHYSVSSSQKAK